MPAPDLAPLLAKPAPALGVKFHYFGDYELLEELARGGMGIVFKARQMSLNRLVALKLISSGTLPTEELVKRFKAEAEAAASLSHPNIVPIYEIGEHQGQHYFSMGLIEGPNLRQRLAQRMSNDECRMTNEQGKGAGQPFDIRHSAFVISKVARAVHYAHQRGVLHRDLKPSNILLDAQGQPHLTDFGLAKLVQKESTLTHTNAVMGTPAYMSPEQACGETKGVTTAADVYGLGAVLYETLTGSPPFGGGTSMETIRQVLDQDPRRPSLWNPAVDRDLETICLKCLEKEPSRRYGSAEAFADDLDRWHRREPIQARPSSTFERAQKWIRRQPVLAATVVLLLVVLALGFAGVLWQWREAVVARHAESAERRRAELAETDALARLREAKLNYVRANRLTGRPGQRFDSLAELARAASSSNSLDLRNEAIACLVLPDLRRLKTLAKTPRGDSLRFETSLQRYVTNDSLGNLIIRDTETDAVRYEIPHQGASIIASLTSPDERFLATSDLAGRAHLWSLPKPTPRSLEFPSDAVLIAFSPDSRALVIKHADGSLHFLNTTNGAEERSFPGPPKLAWPYQFQVNSAGDKFMTLVEGKLIVRRTSDGGQLMTIEPPAGATTDLASAVWHPDGRRVASYWLSTVGLWDSVTGRQLGVFEGHEGPIVGLAFTATGEYLASTSWDGTTRLWHAATHREMLRLSDAGNVLCISPDSRRLSFQSWDYTRAQLYELATTAAQRFDLPPPTRALVHWTTEAVFSPDGELVAVSDTDGIYFFRFPNPAPVALAPIPDIPHVSSVRFAPDGSALLTGGADGAQRWPMMWSADHSELHLGPPEVLEATRGLPVTWVDLSEDGQWLLAQSKNIVLTFRPALPSEVVRFDRGIQLGNPTRLSPDGTLVVGPTRSRDFLQIWNGRTGGLITNLPTVGAAQPKFSLDGRWLACPQKDSTTIWETADWSLRCRIPHPSEDTRHPLAFSPDGRIVAIGISERETRLARVDTGGELATLPTGQLMTSMHFSPTGDRLAVANEAGYFQLWDLRQLREQLAAIHLDWDMPPYPPKKPALANRPLRVIVHTNGPTHSRSDDLR